MSRSLDHSLNNSTSKMKYSFCKASRFLPTIRSECDIYYDVPNFRSRRSTSFGYGNKIDLTIKSPAPSPSRYTQPSAFDNPQKRGFSFGFGRDVKYLQRRRQSAGLSRRQDTRENCLALAHIQ